MMAKLADLHQGELPELSFGKFEPRSLLNLVLDNSVERCIFETFSALKALQQAENAADPVIEGTMRAVVLDEISHAELAWDIHKYLMTILSEDDQTTVYKAQREAVRRLLHSTEPSSYLSEKAKK